MQSYDPKTAALSLDDTTWQRPIPCGDNSGNCVEVNLARPGLVAVRDSKLGESPVLLFTPEEWTAFVTSVRAGQFDC